MQNGASCDMRSSVVSESKGTSVVAKVESTLTAIGNTVELGAAGGVLFSQKSDGTLRDNEIKGNAGPGVYPEEMPSWTFCNII